MFGVELTKDLRSFFNMFDVNLDGSIVDKNTGAQITQYIQGTGYHWVNVSRNGVRYRYPVHRLVAIKYLTFPRELKMLPMNKIQVNHKDGNKDNNHMLNLEFCTAYQNNKHARDYGLNNISQSNSRRWDDEAFAERTRIRMKTYCKANPRTGVKNPNFRYMLEFNGKLYTIGELSKILHRAESTIYGWISSNRLHKHKITLMEGQSTIERHRTK